MEWKWIGKEEREDRSGILVLEFESESTSIELPDFAKAVHLAQLLHREIQAAERRGAKTTIDKYARLGKEIAEDAN